MAGDWRAKIIRIDKAKIQIVTVRCRSARQDKSVQWEEKTSNPLSEKWNERNLNLGAGHMGLNAYPHMDEARPAEWESLSGGL